MHNTAVIDGNDHKIISLSTYFPAGTQYFYGYPAGENSGFLNNVAPDVEELVAERAVCCAGDEVSVISFAAPNPPILSERLFDEFALPRLDKSQLILLPSEIDTSVQGMERNDAVRRHLMQIGSKKSLVMAQPFEGQDIEDRYQIPPHVTLWLNDKNNMDTYIDRQFLPQKIADYRNGQEFAKNHEDLTVPVVVKASSSSAGDGVYICLDQTQLAQAAEELADVQGTILAEEYVQAVKNYGVHFGISHDRNQAIDIIGVNEQLTTPDGEFIGGIIRSQTFPAELQQLIEHLRTDVLETVRTKGWYGVGCFDVLVDTKGNLYIIDANFRMTGMSAYHFLVANGQVTTPLLAFSGEYHGNQKALEESLLPFAGKQLNDNKILQLIALRHQDDVWNFNGALLFGNDDNLVATVQRIMAAGVSSKALDQMLQNI